MGHDGSSKLTRAEHYRNDAAPKIGGFEFIHEIAEQRRIWQARILLVAGLQQYSDKVFFAPGVIGLAREVRGRGKRTANDFVAFRRQINLIAAGVTRDDRK